MIHPSIVLTKLVDALPKFQESDDVKSHKIPWFEILSKCMLDRSVEVLNFLSTSNH